MNPMWLVSGPTIVAGVAYLARLAYTYPRRPVPQLPPGPYVVGYSQDALRARIHRNELEEAQR